MKNILDSELSKIAKLKKSCLPFEFISWLITGDKYESEKVITVSDFIIFTPWHIANALKEFNNDSDLERQIRKALKEVKNKLMQAGLTEKSGPFLLGSYLPTMHSPKEEWVTHWITEFNLSVMEAEKLYELAHKVELI
jgi:hypothetical protein